MYKLMTFHMYGTHVLQKKEEARAVHGYMATAASFLPTNSGGRGDTRRILLRDVGSKSPSCPLQIGRRAAAPLPL